MVNQLFSNSHTQAIKSMAKVFTITEGLENLGALKSGGQGSVYKAKRTGEIITAIKILPTPIYSESDDDKNFTSFQNEVQKLKKVNESPNPNVVSILASGITDSGNLPYIEMEYIEGPDLGELLKAPHPPIFTIKETIKVADHLSNALAHCHRANVKHGDIKSNNVKFNQHTGNYILLDFGLSIMSDEQRRTSIRHAGAIEFMAPEQNTGEMFFETDIYSFGVILFELLAGEVPFPLHDKGETARNAVMIAHMETAPPNLMSMRRLAIPESWSNDIKEREINVPGWLINMIYKCLEKNPAKRFKNGLDLQEYIHSGIVTEESKKGIVSLAPVLPANQEASKEVHLLQRSILEKDGLIYELREQLANKESEMYKQRYAETGTTVQKGVSKNLFALVLVLALGLAAYAAYNLFNEQKNINSDSSSITNDSITADSSSLVTSKPTKRRTDTPRQTVIPPEAEEQIPKDLTEEPVNEAEPGRTSGAVAGAKYKVGSTAYFYDRPEETSRRNAYLVVNEEVITALDEQGDFIYVVFTNDNGQTSRGWISKKNLVPFNDY